MDTPSITRGTVNGSRSIRLPVTVVDRVARLSGTYVRLEGTLKRRPTTHELAAELGLSTAEVTELQRYLYEPTSLNQPIGDGGIELHDLIADPSAEAPDEVAAARVVPGGMHALLSTLDARERTVIELRYGLRRDRALSAAEVGRHLDLTRESIRQIEHRAMAKLRSPIRE